MEIDDAILYRVGVYGLAALAVEDRDKLTRLNREVAELKAGPQEVELLKARLQEVELLNESFRLGSLSNPAIADLIIERMATRSDNERLIAQRKEIRGLHGKIKRLEREETANE